MVTKNLETPSPAKQKKARPSGYKRKSPLENADSAKRERMEEYVRMRTLIRGWSKKVQTCDIPELIKIAADARELQKEMERREMVVAMIFKEDFRHIEETAVARLKSERAP